MVVPGLDPGISPGHFVFMRLTALPIVIAGTRPAMTFRAALLFKSTPT
jgi:hypothetical protein